MSKKVFEALEKGLRDLEQEKPINLHNIGEWTVLMSQIQALTGAYARRVTSFTDSIRTEGSA